MTQSDKIQRFRALHRKGEPVILFNIWDPGSARTVASAGALALATGSAPVALKVNGGTLVNAADALLANGAKDVYAYITHGVLSGGAVARITSSRLKELVITDSIQPTEAVKNAANIRSLPIATLIGEAISRTAAEESVSSLFD